MKGCPSSPGWLRTARKCLTPFDFLDDPLPCLRSSFRRKVRVNNIGSGSDEGVLPVEFFGHDFSRLQAPHVLGALTTFNQPNINRLIHPRQSTAFESHCQAL